MILENADRGQAIAAGRTGVRWRLGVATRLLGAPLRPHDARRWQNRPHLSVSLAYVRDILAYCVRWGIGFYRLSSTLAPYATHPDLPSFHQQRRECRRELVAVGDEARAAGVRLTMHPGAFVRLDAESEGLGQRSIEELSAVAALLEEMGMGAESVLVVHGHGQLVECREQNRVSEPAAGESRSTSLRQSDSAQEFGDGSPYHAARRSVHHNSEPLLRFARRVDEMPAYVRKRLVIENGDRTFDLGSAHWLYQRTGLPIVLDLLHHRCNNPSGLGVAPALRLALATWPQGVKPKLHLSSPRTEVRTIQRAEGAYPAPPLANQHSDFINVFECIELLRAADEVSLRPFDIMLEAKAHDLALLRLREQIATYAPAYQGRVW